VISAVLGVLWLTIFQSGHSGNDMLLIPDHGPVFVELRDTGYPDLAFPFLALNPKGGVPYASANYSRLTLPNRSDHGLVRHDSQLTVMDKVGLGAVATSATDSAPVNPLGNGMSFCKSFSKCGRSALLSPVRGILGIYARRFHHDWNSRKPPIVFPDHSEQSRHIGIRDHADAFVEKKGAKLEFPILSRVFENGSVKSVRLARFKAIIYLTY